MIHGHLDPEGRIEDADEYQEIFLGVCHGVGLKRRDKDDPHICLQILTEDDGLWFYSSYGVFSSYWLFDLQQQLSFVQSWLHLHADKDKHGGWKFRE